MKRLNITVPDDLILQMKKISNKSRFIAEAVREKLNREQKKELDRLLEEGYKATKDEDKQLNTEWENITQEGWK